MVKIENRAHVIIDKPKDGAKGDWGPPFLSFEYFEFIVYKNACKTKSPPPIFLNFNLYYESLHIHIYMNWPPLN